MALVEVAMVSGYQASKDSLKLLKADGLVKRYETKGDTVVLYFDEIKSDLTCVSLDVHAVFRVEDVKSSTVKVYDYYQSEYSASSSYILPSGCGAEALPPPVSVDIEPPLALPLVRIEPIDDGVSTGSLQTAAPLMDRGVQNSTFFTIDNFEDLDVPGGIEGPVGLVAVPGSERGCPRCLRAIDRDSLEKAFCNSTGVYSGQARGTRVRLLTEIFTKSEPWSGPTDVDFHLPSDCQCSSLQTKRSKSISVIGLSALSLPTPPEKLVAGPELLIIEQTAKQLKLKSIVRKCNRNTPSKSR